METTNTENNRVSNRFVHAYTRTYVHTHAIFYVCVRAYLYYTYIFVHKARFTLAYQSSDAPFSFSPFLRLLFLCRTSTIFHPFYHSTTRLLLLLLPHCSRCLSFYSSLSVHPVFPSLPQGHPSLFRVDESQMRSADRRWTCIKLTGRNAETNAKVLPRFRQHPREPRDARENEHTRPCCCLKKESELRITEGERERRKENREDDTLIVQQLSFPPCFTLEYAGSLLNILSTTSFSPNQKKRAKNKIVLQAWLKIRS